MSLPPMQIYQFEDEFERAVQTILTQNGVNDVKKQREHKIKLEDGSIQTLKAPRMEVKYLNGGFAQSEHQFITPDGKRWLDLASGIVYLKIVTRRDVVEPSHAYLRGLGRYVMQQAITISGLMKYHIVEKMMEQSSTVTFEADKIHDTSALSFNVWLRIRNTWFPTS